MNRFFKFLLVFCIFSTFALSPFQTLSAEGTEFISENGVKLVKLQSDVDGKVVISGQTSNKKIKLMIVKDTYQEWFDLSVMDGKFNDTIWLTEGIGTYEINIMVNLEGRKYSFGPKATVQNTSEVNRFLVPTKDIDSDDKAISDLAKRLTRLSKTDRDRAKNLYNWVTRNIKYDYAKYRNQMANNYDDVYGAINTLKTKKGVCYDFSTLYAAMSRSLGMETKVVRGNYISGKRLEYHAWNEIYLADEGKWIKLDSTFGYAMNKNYFDNTDFDTDHSKIDEI